MTSSSTEDTSPRKTFIARTLESSLSAMVSMRGITTAPPLTCPGRKSTLCHQQPQPSRLRYLTPSPISSTMPIVSSQRRKGSVREPGANKPAPSLPGTTASGPGNGYLPIAKIPSLQLRETALIRTNICPSLGGSLRTSRRVRQSNPLFSGSQYCLKVVDAILWFKIDIQGDGLC